MSCHSHSDSIQYRSNDGVCIIRAGSGIFVSPSGLLVRTGSVGISFIIWLACGLLSLLGKCIVRFELLPINTLNRQECMHILEDFFRFDCLRLNTPRILPLDLIANIFNETSKFIPPPVHHALSNLHPNVLH